MSGWKGASPGKWTSFSLLLLLLHVDPQEKGDVRHEFLDKFSLSKAEMDKLLSKLLRGIVKTLMKSFMSGTVSSFFTASLQREWSLWHQMNLNLYMNVGRSLNPEWNEFYTMKLEKKKKILFLRNLDWLYISVSYLYMNVGRSLNPEWNEFSAWKSFQLLIQERRRKKIERK